MQTFTGKDFPVSGFLRLNILGLKKALLESVENVIQITFYKKKYKGKVVEKGLRSPVTHRSKNQIGSLPIVWVIEYKDKLNIPFENWSTFSWLSIYSNFTKMWNCEEKNK